MLIKKIAIIYRPRQDVGEAIGFETIYQSIISLIIPLSPVISLVAFCESLAGKSVAPNSTVGQPSVPLGKRVPLGKAPAMGFAQN